MFELNEAEIEMISVDIERQGLTYTLLKNELLDHLCCSIEEEMQQGLTFNEAYRKVRQQMGSKRIRQIQDETLYLVNKRYRMMKKSMYVLGVAVPILIIAATLFKLNHWPGAAILLTLALFTAGVLFLPIFVMVRIRDTRRQNEPVPLALYLSGMIGGMLVILGSLLKIQHWPGAGVCITLGLGTTALVFMPLFILEKMRKARSRKEDLNTNLYLGGALAAGLFLTGVLFKIMHWPGAGIVIVASWTVIAVLFMPLLTLNQLKQKENQINIFFSTVLVISLVAIILMTWVRNDGGKAQLMTGYATIADMSQRNIEMMEQQSQIISSFLDRDLPESTLTRINEINQFAESLCTFMHTAMSDMLEAANDQPEGVIGSDGSLYLKNAVEINRSDVVQGYMLESESGETRATMLQERLIEYLNYASDLAGNAEMKSYIEDLLSSIEERDDSADWEVQIFGDQPLSKVASSMSMYQSAVRIIQTGLLNELVISQLSDT